MGIRRARSLYRSSGGGKARPHQSHAERARRLQNAAAGVQRIEFVGDFRSLLSLRTSALNASLVGCLLCDKCESRTDSHLRRFGVSSF
jgi:hypothetical protein